MSSVSSKKISVFTSIALVVITTQAYANKLPPLPKGWHARLPIHLISPYATTQPGGFSPAGIRQAYGFPANFQGAGETIAIVDAYDDPNIESDLATFSTQFGLPPCTTANGCFTKMYPGGTQPPGDEGWGYEVSLDVEWAHGIAPQAKIILVEAADAGTGLYDAISFAVQQNPSVISISWGNDEFAGEQSYDSIFQTKIPIVVASGDSGSGVWYPAASPYVLSAGGTQLTVDSNGNYVSETAWSGSSGGVSAYETEPTSQKEYVIPQNNRMRGVPDVAYNASISSYYAIYDSYGEGGWLGVGGTSAAAPQWAALIADMMAAKQGYFYDFPFSIYSVARENSLLHDITTGSNGSCGYFCNARSGYDYVTGVGTPMASNLINRFD